MLVFCHIRYCECEEWRQNDFNAASLFSQARTQPQPLAECSCTGRAKRFHWEACPVNQHRAQRRCAADKKPWDSTAALVFMWSSLDALYEVSPGADRRGHCQHFVTYFLWQVHSFSFFVVLGWCPPHIWQREPLVNTSQEERDVLHGPNTSDMNIYKRHKRNKAFSCFHL